MSHLERHCSWVVLAYPVSYRRARGGEIRDTLVEVSRPGSAWPPAAEMAAVVAAGLRRRAGLAVDQPVGSLAGFVAGWYLTIAVAMAASAVLMGEWAPWAPPLRSPFGFGPFATDGMPVYAAVLFAGAASWAGREAAARVLAVVAIGLAGVMVVFEHEVSFWGRPPLSFVVPMLVCVLPTMLRSPLGRDRSESHDRILSLLAAVSALAVPVWLGLVDLHFGLKFGGGNVRWSGTDAQFYRETVGDLARWVPSAGLAVLIGVVALRMVGRRVLASGVLCLMAPWLLLAVLVTGSPTAGASFSGSDAVAVATAPQAAVAVTAAFGTVALVLGFTRRHRPAPARS
jgi:hypothetical protein